MEVFVGDDRWVCAFLGVTLPFTMGGQLCEQLTC